MRSSKPTVTEERPDGTPVDAPPPPDPQQTEMDFADLKLRHGRLLSIMAEEDECRQRLHDARRVVRELCALQRRLKVMRAAVVHGERRLTQAKG